MDRKLEEELRSLGLHPPRPFMLSQESARDLGATCRDCGSKKVVYTITKPLKAGKFDAGSYCYRCLLKRCSYARLIPYPIELGLLNRLKEDLGIPLEQAPTAKFSFTRGKKVF